MNGRSRNRYVPWIYLLWIGIQMPFLPTAFRIDEPYFLAVARQISEHPFDPYGFRINWDGTLEWAYRTLANPPLVPAFLAAWSLVFPWNEISLHLAILASSLVALHAFTVLSRSYDTDATISTALLACSPAFFLGSQVAMQDVPMLALLLTAISYAMVYEKQGQPHSWCLSSLAAFACPLAKYTGLIVIPLLFFLLAVSRRRNRMAIIAAAPVISLLLWNGFTWLQYGSPHMLAMLHFQRNPAVSLPLLSLGKGVASFLGLGVLPLALLAFVLNRRHCRRLLVWSAMLIFPFAHWHASWIGYRWDSCLLFALSVTLSCYFIGLSLRHGWQSWRRGDARVLLLLVWIVAGLAFQTSLMFASVRYLLFLAPPVILLVLVQSQPFPRSVVLRICMALSFLLTLGIAIADSQTANAYRAVVSEQILPQWQRTKGRLYFSGHWGFQYYLEHIGGQAIDKYHPPTLQPGDLVAIAAHAWPDVLEPRLAAGLAFSREVIRLTPSGIIRTIDCPSAANFYASKTYGCELPTILPFGFGQAQAEQVFLFLVHESRPKSYAGPTITY